MTLPISRDNLPDETLGSSSIFLNHYCLNHKDKYACGIFERDYLEKFDQTYFGKFPDTKYSV